MTFLLDSRCIAALVAIACIPFALASLLHRDALIDLYEGLDSELGALAQLLVNRETGIALAIVVLGAIAATVRAIGAERATPETVRALQVAIGAVLVGSLVALQAVVGPVERLFDAIR